MVLPASEWTKEARGSVRVEVAGIRDKQQITVTLAGALSGTYLKVLYEGNTARCHPVTAFPEGCDFSIPPITWAIK